MSFSSYLQTNQHSYAISSSKSVSFYFFSYDQHSYHVSQYESQYSSQHHFNFASTHYSKSQNFVFLTFVSSFHSKALSNAFEFRFVTIKNKSIVIEEISSSTSSSNSIQISKNKKRAILLKNYIAWQIKRNFEDRNALKNAREILNNEFHNLKQIRKFIKHDWKNLNILRNLEARLQKKIKIFLIEYNNIKSKKYAIEKQNEEENLHALFLIAKSLKHDD